MKLVVSVALALVGGIAALAVTAPAASAIDCAKAKTGTEKAICADPKARQSDDDMVAAFAALKAKLKPAQQKVLVANQAEWITSRDLCSDDQDGQPENDQQKIGSCVVRQTEARRKFLSGLPIEGPGAPDPLRPVIKEGADQSFFTSLGFIDPSTPAEKLFNSTLDADLQKFHLAANADDYSDGFDVTLKYASPTLISAYLDTSDQSPKLAHPMSSAWNLNIDMTTGKELKMADALDAKGLAAVETQCLAQLKDYLANPDLSVGDVDPGLIKIDIDNLNTWSFGATEATLIFDPIDAEPNGVCKFPYDDLRKIIRPGFPLPK